MIPPGTPGEWIRVKTDRDVDSATAYFHFSSGYRGGRCRPSSAACRPRTRPARQSEGILQPAAGMDMPLALAATVVDTSGKAAETGYYVIGADLHLRRVDDPAAETEPAEELVAHAGFPGGRRFGHHEGHQGQALPPAQGRRVFSSPAASGWRRGIREIVTERNLMNIHGTFYEMPRPESGGLAKIRPITTHNRRIFDFASWRGLLVLSGNLAGAAADGHYLASDDGKVGLWLGNLEDLWKLGPPRGQGGPWHEAAVRAGKPSDPYLMTGYENKQVQLSHDRPAAVRFTIEVDFLANGTWHTYQTLTVPAGQTVTHVFPDGFSAHWVRVKPTPTARPRPGSSTTSRLPKERTLRQVIGPGWATRGGGRVAGPERAWWDRESASPRPFGRLHQEPGNSAGYFDGRLNRPWPGAGRSGAGRRRPGHCRPRRGRRRRGCNRRPHSRGSSSKARLKSATARPNWPMLAAAKPREPGRHELRPQTDGLVEGGHGLIGLVVVEIFHTAVVGLDRIFSDFHVELSRILRDRPSPLQTAPPPGPPPPETSATGASSRGRKSPLS